MTDYPTLLTMLILGGICALCCHRWIRAEAQISDTMFLLRNGWRHLPTMDGWIHPLVKSARSSVFSLADAVRFTRESNWPLHQLIEASQAESATAREEALAFKVRVLKSQIRHKDETLRQKNVMLDALYYVWCSGGCKGGTRRWLPKDVTEETVVAAERNTERLRRWWNISKSRRIE